MKINEQMRFSFRFASSSNGNRSKEIRSRVAVKNISEANRLKRKKVRDFLSLCQEDKAFAELFEFGGLSSSVKEFRRMESAV